MSKFNMMKSMKFALLFILTNSALLAPSYASVQVNFTGNLIGNPPCDITGADVVFEDVGVTKIDGVNYTQDVDVFVTCPDDTGQLYIAYSGMRADSFDSKALQTSVAGLGIRLYYNNTVIAPDNNDIPITIPNGDAVKISLSAVPVRDLSPSFILLEQSFTATGTVEVRYP